MESKALILVTYAKTYEIDNGARGTSVNYYFLDEHGAFLRDSDDGQQNAKVSMSFEDRNKFSIIPGVYEGTFSMTIGSDRKPTLRLSDVAFHSQAFVGVDPAAGKTADNKKPVNG